MTSADVPLPGASRVGRVALQVHDVDRSVRFYRDVVGLQVIDETAAGGRARASLGAAGGPPLLELLERPGVRPSPRRGLLGLYHFALLLPDRPSLATFVRHLRRAGATAASADHGFSEALYLVDPDGLQIEVYCDRPRERWPVQDDGRYVGVTYPLDFTDLLRTAEARGWQGAPPGSTIGHVHLNVSDLTEASRFYADGLGLRPSIAGVAGALFVAAGEYHHHVGLNTWIAPAPSATDDDARLSWWELIVPGSAAAEAIAARMHERGYAVRRNSPADVAVTDAWGITVHVRIDQPPDSRQTEV